MSSTRVPKKIKILENQLKNGVHDNQLIYYQLKPRTRNSEVIVANFKTIGLLRSSINNFKGLGVQIISVIFMTSLLVLEQGQIKRLQ